MNFTQYKYYYQSQAIALPADPRDPFLTHWVKPRDSNPLPMAPPPGGLRAQFRDPISPWLVPTNQIGADLAAWLGWQNAGFAAGGAPAAGGGVGGGEEEEEARGVGAGAGGVWFTAVGALDDCVGSAALYSSPDLTSWTYAGACKIQMCELNPRQALCMVYAHCGAAFTVHACSHGQHATLVDGVCHVCPTCRSVAQ